MVFKSKRCVAQTVRQKKRKAAESTPEPQHELEMFVEAEPACKQEPPEAGQDEPMPLHLEEIKVEMDLLDPTESSLVEEIKVEVDILDPKESSLMVEEQFDPVVQDPVEKLCPQMKKTRNKIQQQNRCQFCLKQFRAGGKFVTIAKSRIEFVLGLSDWKTPGMQTYGCKNCRKTFEKFYEFKQSCLQALERSAEILPWIGANKEAEESVDSKPKNKKAKLTESQPARNETKDVPQTEVFDGLDNGSTLPNETAEEPIVPEISTELPVSDDDSNISAPEPVPIVPENSTELPVSDDDLDISAPEPVPIVPEISTELPVSDDDSDISAPEPDPLHDEPADKKRKKSYCCPRCRKYFPIKTIYLSHKPSCFEANPRPEPSIQCSLCPRKFRTQRQLAYHIDKHNGVRTIPCRREGCTKTFFCPEVRTRHEKICGQVGQFICNVCGTMFKSEPKMRAHQGIHGDPQFACDICSKAFHKKEGLKRHIATHSEERNFQCKVCGKRFKTAETNRVHQRIHTQERRYACNICDQRFMHNFLLKRHLEKGHEPV